MSATVAMEATRPGRAGGWFTRSLAATIALVLAFVGIGLMQPVSASAAAPSYQVDATITMSAPGDNLAVDSTRGVVYVAQRNAGAVAVYDTGTLQLLRTVAVPNQPFSIAIDEPSGYVYVTQFTGNGVQGTLAVIAPGGTSVAATINLGNSPTGIIRSAFGPTLYVANFSGNSIMYIDISTPSAPVVARTVPVTLTPTNVSENATGSQLYVTSSPNSRYFVFNIAAGTQGAQWTGISQPYEAMPNPAGTSVFATSGSSALRIMNPATNLQTGTGISNVRSLSRDLAMESMFAAVAPGSVAVLDPATGALLQSLPAPAASMIDTDTVRHRTFVTSLNGTSLTVIGRVPVLPTITTNPTSVTVNEFQPASFTAAFTSESTTTTQWQSSPDGTTWTNVPAATNNTLNIASAPYSSNGLQYRAVFTNGAGSIATSAATLTVNPLAPIVTVDPASVTITEGSSATFSAAATSSVAQTQTWQRSSDGTTWTTIPGETGATMTLGAVPLTADGTLIRSVFTSTAGSTATAAATLNVEPAAPVLAANPGDLSVVEGDDATFVASATSSVAQTVRWERSTDGLTWTVIAGATSESLTIADVQLSQNGLQVRAVFTNSAGSVITDAATLTVTPAPPVVILSPLDTIAQEHGNAAFTAAARSSVDMTVQWQTSSDGITWTNVPGATSTTLRLTDVIAAQNGLRLRAVFTNAAGSAVTDAATLTVIVTPVPIPFFPPDGLAATGLQTNLFVAGWGSVALIVLGGVYLFIAAARRRTGHQEH